MSDIFTPATEDDIFQREEVRTADMDIVPGMIVILRQRPSLGFGKVTDVKGDVVTVWFLQFAPGLVTHKNTLKPVIIDFEIYSQTALEFLSRHSLKSEEWTPWPISFRP